MSRKAFQYRLYPNKQQEHHLLFVLRRCRELYNSALEQRKAYYQMGRKSLDYSAQAAELSEIKAAYPAYQDIHSQVLQDVLRRLDKAFAAFFRRLKNGEKPGYPRFKGSNQYDSFTYPQSGFALAGDVLTLAKIGDVKVRVHRPMVGQVKTCTIKQDVNHWHVTFSCEVEDERLPPSEEAVGIDLGLLHFATLSTGETIENPRHYRKGLKRLKRLSQVKGRHKKGCHRRKRAALALAKAHRKVRNQRKDFQQKTARAVCESPQYKPALQWLWSSREERARRALALLRMRHRARSGPQRCHQHFVPGPGRGPQAHGPVEAPRLSDGVLHNSTLTTSAPNCN